MTRESELLHFEKAKELKELLDYINITLSKQKVELESTIDRDIFGYFVDKGYLSIQVLFIHGGKIVERHSKIIPVIDEVEEELTRYIASFYEKDNLVPKEILVPDVVNEEVLSEVLDTSVKIPIRGVKKKIVDMACENAKITLENEFKLIETKDKLYIASVVIKNIKTCNQILKNKKEYAVYTNEELISIHDFSFMNKYRSYKKLIKFIKRNYYVEKNNFKIVNNYVFIPFITQYQMNKDTGLKVLSTLIDQHFEFNNEKHKKKFIDLIEKMALDYPAWELKGHNRRGEA